MHNHEINLNVSDGDGNTALHVASKFGHISCIKVLVENEVDLTAQNHLGHKPADAARAFSHTACFEYLTALETSLLLAYEVSSLEEELHNVRMETFELKKHYKDVLSCARKSLKEKEELGTELKLLRTHINQFNEYVVSEVQVLKQDSTFDDKEKSTSRNEDKQNLLENLIEQYDNIQCQLQESYNRCCSKSALAEREAKILAADEKWRKIKSRMGHSVNPCRKPIAILNEILGQVYCRSSNVRFEELGHLSTSESSLTSLGSASVICEKLVPHKPMVDKTPTKTKVCHFQKRRGEQTGELKRVSSVPSIPGPAMPSSRESPFLVKLLGNQLPVKSESSTKSEKPAKDDKQDEIDSNICTNRLECSVMSKASDSPSLKNCDTFNEELPPSPITEPQHTLLSSQPDLIKETKDVRAWESSSKNPGTNRTGICDWISEDYKADLLRNEVPPVPHPRINRSSDGFPYAPKRRGFLHKFAIRWPSKRKDIKPHNDHNEITPEDFKETYLARNDNDKRTSADTISIATTKDGSVKSSNKDYTESERDKVYEMVKADNTKTDSQTNERMQKYDGSTSGGETSIITLSDLAESQSCSAIFQLPLASKNLNTPNNANHTSTSSSKAKNITRLDFAALRAGGFPLWKTVTGSVDLLPDSSTVSRMSPAPSEVSKTESALFPPPSDLSHTESIRHSHQLGKIEEVGSRDAIKIALKVRQKQETLVSTKEEVVQGHNQM
uniref:Uncharacterized protein n=1 Tax=Strigamia maritima TaxID=126957 RepID=T1JER6_STRMM